MEALPQGSTSYSHDQMTFSYRKAFFQFFCKYVFKIRADRFLIHPVLCCLLCSLCILNFLLSSMFVAVLFLFDFFSFCFFYFLFVFTLAFSLCGLSEKKSLVKEGKYLLQIRFKYPVAGSVNFMAGLWDPFKSPLQNILNKFFLGLCLYQGILSCLEQ